MTVTTGGMAFNENVNLNTGIIVGGAQTWTVAAGKVLTVNANINTHISPLTINCIGDTVVNGAIRDVRGDSRWNGLLTDSSGSVTKSGTGTLTFSGNNTYTGDTAITAGTIRLGPTQAGLSEGSDSIHYLRHHQFQSRRFHPVGHAHGQHGHGHYRDRENLCLYRVHQQSRH